jgi:gamma-glutamylcyclotransferase (GGCT)/AIG2-like uncharacterized protein YtfP
MIDRLFVYGTLAPGRPNEHILANVAGEWEPASVTGRLLEEGWGAAAGYPGMFWMSTAPKSRVYSLARRGFFSIGLVLMSLKVQAMSA